MMNIVRFYKCVKQSILSTLVLSLGAYFGRPSSKKTNEGLSFDKPYSRATSASSILTKLTRGANVDISSSIVSNISKIRKSKLKLKQLLPVLILKYMKF